MKLNEKYKQKLELTEKRLNAIMDAAEKRREEHLKQQIIKKQEIKENK